MSTITTTTEIDGLKARLKDTWMAGDYDRFSRYMEQGARVFYEQLDVPAGSELLDVACGSGQVALWAARDGVRMTRRQYNFNYPFPPTEVVEFFRQYYGPTNRAVGSLNESDGRQLRQELEEWWSAHNRAGDELTVVQAEYLDVIATRT